MSVRLLFKVIVQISVGVSICSASDITVFEVSKNIPLNNDEIVYKDFYLNGGATQGVKKNMVLAVYRKTPIHDNLKNKSQGFLLNTIARVQVIHVEQEFSVARLFSVQERDSAPLTDLEGILVGDYVDLSSAQEIKENIEKPTKKSHAKVEKDEGQADHASLAATKLKAEAAPPVAPAPVHVAPPSIGLPKGPAIDKSSP